MADTDLDADRQLLLRYLDLLAAKFHDDYFYPWASTVREIRSAIAAGQYRRAERLGWRVSDVNDRTWHRLIAPSVGTPQQTAGDYDPREGA